MEVQRRKGGPPVNADGLRRIPLASIMSQAARLALMRMEEGDLLPAWDVGDPLEEVALTHRLAHAAGEPPTKAVMERLDISRSSASRRIAKARERDCSAPRLSAKPARSERDVERENDGFGDQAAERPLPRSFPDTGRRQPQAPL
jgi:hypothetical protein